MVCQVFFYCIVDQIWCFQYVVCDCVGGVVVVGEFEFDVFFVGLEQVGEYVWCFVQLFVVVIFYGFDELCMYLVEQFLCVCVYFWCFW